VRLDPRFRAALYGTFAVLFATGAAWLVADRLKTSPDGETWQAVASYLLMTHGGSAMVTLMLLGALVPVHLRRGWRAERNRITGAAMATFNATLIATSFGLYYLGSDAVRAWVSDLHIALGFSLPILFLAHLLVGRRRSSP
jgi:hypothetical protein